MRIYQFKKIIITGFISFLSFTVCAATSTEKIASLNQLIIHAQNQNIDVSREQMTVRMAELFLDWADWDEANQASNEKFYAKHPIYKDTPAAHAAALPEFERSSVNTILDNAINELTKVINGDIVRQPVPNIDFNQVVISDGEFRLADDSSIFLSTYTWKPDDPLTNPYFGNLNSEYISPNFVTTEQGDTPQWRLDQIRNNVDQRIGQVFVNHNNIPQWILDKYPDIADTERLFSKYLISHPGAKELFQVFFAQYIPELKDKRSTALGYMVFNEPSFFTQQGVWNTGGISDAAMAQFRLWLAEKHGSIDALNALWNSTYQSFDNINIEIPMAGSFKGQAIWYDWMRFNQIRVTQWFEFLDNEIKKHDSDANVHIKLMPWLWNDNARDHGMDFESLLEITDIIGFDANSEYLSHRKGTPWYQGEYSFDWQSPALSFDFFSSVQPDQVLWDSENHFFNKGSFHLKDVDADYVRAIYWLAATHGLDGVSTWMWGRNTDGSNVENNRGTDSEYITDVTHQPLGFHELTRTIMDINAHHNQIKELQDINKSIRIFYSETSAINQDNYMDSIREGYKALYFDGLALGFVTEKIINGHINDWGFIVVKDSQQVTASELASLKAYVDNGGSLLIDNQSLKKDEYGRTHAANLLPNSERVITYSSNADLHNKMLTMAASKHLLPAIKIDEMGDVNNKKVAWRVVKNDNTSYTVSLVNLGVSETTINIAAADSAFTTSIKNLITGTEQSNTLTLAVRETKLLEVTVKAAEPITEPTPEPPVTPTTPDVNNNQSSGGGSLSYLWFLVLGCLLPRKLKIKSSDT